MTTGETPKGISPRALNLAKEKNVDIRLVSPSGPNGRIIERDIQDMINKETGIITSAAKQAQEHLTEPPAPRLTKDEYEESPLTGIRMSMVKQMTESFINIPRLTNNFSFDASEIIAYRKKLKENAGTFNLPNITLNDFILYAASRLLLHYPGLNAHIIDGKSIRYFKTVNLGFAVDTAAGLMVPVIKKANLKSLSEIACESKRLSISAKEGTIAPDDMTRGTFTISNLGALNAESFTPLIFPPQTGILGINSIIQRVREVNGQISVYPAMGISITYDYRAIDGAPASHFANQLCRFLENFTLQLI